jgi:hypothetical protein
MDAQERLNSKRPTAIGLRTSFSNHWISCRTSQCSTLWATLVVQIGFRAKRGKGSKPHESNDKTPQQHNKAMTCAQRLKRVFNIPQGTLS